MMENKISSLLGFYKQSLSRKENILAPLNKKRSNFEDFSTTEEIKFATLSTEIRMLKEFIEELENL